MAVQNAPAEHRPQLSVVIPIYNEEEALPSTLEELREALDSAGVTDWEAVLVDDGSRDRSREIAREFAARDPRFRPVQFKANCGQTAAFDAGLRAARGVLLAMMDADGQNDPHDFPRLMAALEEQGVDMMTGYRAVRQDSVVRRISSRIGNGVRNWATRESIRDVGCQIRVFKASGIERLKLFEGMHRFFPTMYRMEGNTVGEMAVNHRPRTKGQSKYGIGNRLWRSIKDLMAVRWMQTRGLRYEIVDAEASSEPVASNDPQPRVDG